MTTIFWDLFGTQWRAKTSGGFTLVEVLVAMATASLLLIGVVAAYNGLINAQSKNKQMTKQHRKLRGPVSLAALDIQGAGRSGLQPRSAGNYGVVDITRKALDGTADPAGYQALVFTTLTEDRNSDGRIDDDDNPPHTITWRLFDFDGDGRPDLGKFDDDNIGGAVVPLLMARNVENIGFAFATDGDRDGVLDEFAGQTQWVVNVADAAGQLDYRVNEDGTTVLLAAPIPLNRIRQIKVYLLVRAETAERNYVNKNTYVLGPTVVVAPGDPYRRQVLTIGVSMRNREPDLAL